MHTVTIFSALIGLSRSIPLSQVNPSSPLVELPIILSSTPNSATAGVAATSQFAGSTETIQLKEIPIPAFKVGQAMLANGFELRTDVSLDGTLLAFPITIHKVGGAQVPAGHQGDITLGPITLPSMSVNFAGLTKSIGFRADSTIGNIKISPPALGPAKRLVNFMDEFVDVGVKTGDVVSQKKPVNNKVATRQVNFWDEFIDIGIEIGNIIINPPRRMARAIELSGVEVTVHINGTAVSVSMSG
ncbi:hypothetical protein BS50DRAFT_649631 [Corynespora cassiicola Philippines]|uniref:Uncharacterized protein n=1 Tax=Corynespora cassiicola Philippines TaxID=1448308 RepID=A0A2T2NC01_CORCC|nr:hypothetical protein BS50DRAFT_649631 [Corynespora cassiicola Philippines]